MFGRLGVVNAFFDLQYYQSMMDWTLSVGHDSRTGMCNQFFKSFFLAIPQGMWNLSSPTRD